jgi:hypothetical protein
LDGLDMGFGKYGLEYDVGAQQRLTDRLSSLWPRNEPARSERAQTNSGEWRRLLPIALLLGGLGLGLLLLVRRLRRVELPMTRDVTEGRGLMKLALSTVRKRGFVRGPGETLLMLAQRLTDEGDPCAPSFAQLVEHYYAHRFGQLPLDRVEITRLMRELQAIPPQASSRPTRPVAMKSV